MAPLPGALPQNGRMLQALSRDRGTAGIQDRAFLFAAVGYAAFSVLDCVTTVVALGHGAHERNPIAAALVARYGAGSLFAFKAAVVALILTVLAWMPRRVAVWVTL